MQVRGRGSGEEDQGKRIRGRGSGEEDQGKRIRGGGNEKRESVIRESIESVSKCSTSHLFPLVPLKT